MLSYKAVLSSEGAALFMFNPLPEYIMQLRHSQRKAAKMRLALQGASGSGKTYSSLLIAHGMTSDWSKIAVIDTENGSADLYAHLGSYNVLALSEPYNPEKYIEAIGICESAGMEVIIIDSISHCWDYLLDFHANLQGNSFANWAKVTPRQNAFIQRILNSSSHVICTMRSKQEYVLNERNGKMIPEKVGTWPSAGGWFGVWPDSWAVSLPPHRPTEYWLWAVAALWTCLEAFRPFARPTA